MADDVDNAQRHIDAELSAALAVRKPVPTRCECGEPCVVLPNGARARFCPDCLTDFQGAGNARD
jgi:hypothetical protein